MLASTELPTRTTVEDILKAALEGSGIHMRRTWVETGVRSDLYAKVERLGAGHLACFRHEWEALTSGGRAFFYWDEGWRHATTGEDMPAYLSRVLWDPSHAAGRLNIDSGWRLCAYLRRAGLAITIEAGDGR